MVYHSTWNALVKHAQKVLPSRVALTARNASHVSRYRQVHQIFSLSSAQIGHLIQLTQIRLLIR